MTTPRARIALAIAVTMLPVFTAALEAGRGARGGARTSVNRSGGGNRGGNVQRNTNVNRNNNINRNNNVNINNRRDIDIDVDVDHRGYGYGGCCYHDHYHPVATAAAVAVTAAVIGSVVYSLPTSCRVVMVNGYTYQQCGSTWYQPQFIGTTTSYVVVTAPR